MPAARVPRPRTALLVAAAALLAIVVSGWLATRPGVQDAQAGMVRWLNDPPPPLSWIFALVNPLLRPVPLAMIAGLLVVWVLWTAGSTSARLEVVRAAAVSFAVAELVAQALKRIASQARPLAVLPGLDTHGYPGDPRGNAYPSAHTAIVVALVAGLWPWLRPRQRVVGVVLAVAVPLHRVYIGAHWPVDLVGGAAVGLLAAAVAWLVAARWPLARAAGPDPGVVSPGAR